jgi:hypothetical protein
VPMGSRPLRVGLEGFRDVMRAHILHGEAECAYVHRPGVVRRFALYDADRKEPL